MEGWVAKLLARLISAESSLGSNPDIPQKSYARYISEGVANTLCTVTSFKVLKTFELF